MAKRSTKKSDPEATEEVQETTPQPTEVEEQEDAQEESPDLPVQPEPAATTTGPRIITKPNGTIIRHG